MQPMQVFCPIFSSIIIRMSVLFLATCHHNVVVGEFRSKGDGKSIYFHSNGHVGEYGKTVQLCDWIGGRLPSLHSNDDAQFLAQFTSSDTVNPGIWLGADRVDGKTFRWSDGSEFDYANWIPGQPDCVNYKCSLILIAQISQSDHLKMKADKVFNKHRQVCVIDMEDDAAVEKAYQSCLRNESGIFTQQDAGQLAGILFGDDDVSDVMTVVRRMKTIKRVSDDVKLVKVISCIPFVVSVILLFVVYYIYKMQNSYLHLKQSTSIQRDVSD